MNIKNLSVDSIDLSVRSTNCLRRAGIHTVGEMLLQTEESLSAIRNMGKKSVDEIIAKIHHYQQLLDASGDSNNTVSEEDFRLWIQDPDHREDVLRILQREKVSIDVIDLLSVKSYNLLQFNGFEYLHQIAFLSESALLELHRMTSDCAAEIVKRTASYLCGRRADFVVTAHPTGNTPEDLLTDPMQKENIHNYLLHNDLILMETDLSNRPKNQLARNGYHKLSDIFFLTQEELQRLPSMGVGSVKQVLDLIQHYWEEHRERLLAYCSGDASALPPPAEPNPLVSGNEDKIRASIRELYREKPFSGLSFPEMAQALEASDPGLQITLKSVIGKMLADHELEYVDFRCYRAYPTFRSYLAGCTAIKDSHRVMINKRLNGMTLEAIAQEHGCTRERVRQVLQYADRVRTDYEKKTGDVHFDEDYYRYFFETYDFDHREASQWLGISDDVWNYLALMDAKPGKKELPRAIEDVQHLDAGLRQKVRNYLNRDRLYVDGMWIEKKRPRLEQYVVQKFCTEDTTYGEFVRIYNDFLTREELYNDLYITDDTYRSRKGILQSAQFLLWKQNEVLRYYDIEGRDFTELLEGLNLESYENIEISTAKLMKLHPEILKKYDIRDQYELHNLLRKTVPEGSYHNFRCGKMPEIRFGEFDRTAAILELLIVHSPIRAADLIALIQEEFGYEPGVIQGTYLQPFSCYYHRGMYSVDQKAMSTENMALLKAALTNDFYYMDEVRKIFLRLVPGGDPEEVNPYNLKAMGFLVLSRYVLQNHASLEAYFEALFTQSDIVDIKPLRERFVYVQMFYQKLLGMKRNLEVVEFEPNSLIQFRKLEQSGVTRALITAFCDEVYAFAPDGLYWTINSLKADGFESDLFDLGFSDWFYANLLLSDDRFSNCMLMNNLFFVKGQATLTVRDFLTERIRHYGSVDYFDLWNELENRYGCHMAHMRDIRHRCLGSEVFYDPILDRFYASEELYYRELEMTGGF